MTDIQTAGDAPAPSIEESIAAAMRDTTDAPTDTPAVQPPAASDTPPPADTGQPRGPDGKFAAKAADATDTPPVDAPPVTTDPAAVLGEAPKIPAAVPAALKDKFLGADPELRAWIESREADTHKQFTRNDEERNLGKSMRDVITPYMPLITAQGGNPVTAVQSLLNTAYILNTAGPEQKAALFRQLAEQYKVPLEGLASPQPFVDPAFETLQQRIDRLERERETEAQAARQREGAALASDIAAFAQAPGHEHFEQVKADMAALLNGGRAQDLQTAYDMAIWARPDLRSTLLSQRDREAEQQRIAAATAAAEAAKRASGSVVGGPGATSPAAPNPNRSLEDEIRAQVAAHSGRL
jgi:hypothetical protein